MLGEWVDLNANDGHALKAYEVKAQGVRYGGIVVAMEIFGVTAHIRRVCDDYAGQGYDVIAPQLYDRVAPGADLPYDAAGVEKGRAIRAKIDPLDTMRDIDAARAALVDGGLKIGVVGFCYGGAVAWSAAAKVPGLACAVGYYGTAILSTMDYVPRCPTLLHFGAKDATTPPDKIEELATLHPDVAIHVYDADHGFNCDERAAFDPTSATLARERTLDFLKANLS